MSESENRIMEIVDQLKKLSIKYPTTNLLDIVFMAEKFGGGRPRHYRTNSSILEALKKLSSRE